MALLLVGASVVINVDTKGDVSQARAGGVGEELKSVVEALADVSVVLDYAPMAECKTRKRCLKEIRDISQTSDVILVVLEPVGDDLRLTAERSKKRRARLIKDSTILSGRNADHSMQLAQLVGTLFALKDIPTVASKPPPPPPPPSSRPPPPPASTAPPPEVVTETSASGPPPVGGWVLLAGGAALGGIAGALFGVAETDLGNLNDKLAQKDANGQITGIDFQQASDERDAIDLKRTIAFLVGGVGAAALVGAVVWLALPTDPEPTGSLGNFDISIGPDGAYASAGFNW